MVNVRYKQFLTPHLGRPVQFQVAGNPKQYRGFLSEVLDDHFVIVDDGHVPTTCHYVDIALGSLILLDRSANVRP